MSEHFSGLVCVRHDVTVPSLCVVVTDAKKAESDLMQEWFNMVHEKNVLVRYESELMVQ